MSKKDTARPRFVCPKCSAAWVYHEARCIVCGTQGRPLNGRAERIVRKLEREREEMEKQKYPGLEFEVIEDE